MKTVKDVDEYIGMFPEEVQEKLQQIRVTIKKAAPKLVEVIKYDMPGYMLVRNVVFFAGYKNHIGFYGVPSADKEIKKELSVYKEGRGSVQFPLNKPLPLALIARMVKLRVKEDRKKGEKIEKAK